MVDEFAYPHNLIAVEVPITVVGTQKRCDAIVYNQQMQPLMVIEFKAPYVPLTQEVLDQAVVYNHEVNVPFLMLCNGTQSMVVRCQDSQHYFLDSIPLYAELIG